MAIQEQPARASIATWEAPPRTVAGILYRLGPGLIIAGSIVGSGELIATTKTGAEAGMALLWLIILGCVIKVFVQVEFGRFSIVNGLTTMDGLNQVPGPRLGSGNWIVWYWFIMFLASMGQLGGIVGGVGQAMAISVPLTEAGRRYNQYLDAASERQVIQAELRLLQRLPATSERQQRITNLKRGLEKLEQFLNQDSPPPAQDSYLWATLITVVTSVLLVLGRYAFIQNAATLMVAIFTLLTVMTVAMLQMSDVWHIGWDQLLYGLGFHLPEAPATRTSHFSPLGTALATFGIIGVGASELVAYPYWCLEKGYARYTGPREASDQWAERARGWMRVMRWDAFCSLLIYTFATVAFYLLGAGVLHRCGLNPEKDEMIRTLSVMYEPVFGRWATVLFLFGAFAVLYSTFFVANASLARVLADVLRVLGLASTTAMDYRRRVYVFSGVLPFVCLVIYQWVRQPALLVLISGVVQAVMLPMLACAAIFFRYYRCDSRIAPGRFWDVWLWISAAGMSVAGLYALWDTLRSAVSR
ncbi:MAG: Mn(2+) transporter [Pirellulaceae bacterium]|nr:MAG: Mn(2+) transporter [Pirellulaceae bacterium]GIW96632.1 MAG: Mn(2+) transporter [Pirellulaceae bacterium]